MLITHIENGDSAGASKLLAAGADVTARGRFGQTPLHLAAEKGMTELCNELLEHGADLEARDEFGKTALLNAIAHSKTETARLLLQRGAMMSYTYKAKDTPEERKRVTKRTRTGMVHLDLSALDLPEDLLIEINSTENIEGMISDQVELHFQATAMHAIEECQGLDTLKMLVTEFEADMDYIDPAGYWPLKLFAEAADFEAVQWLVSQGADLETTSTGETAIFAALHHDFRCARFLVEKGANVNAVDVDGWTPIFAARTQEAVKLLLDHGADPTITDQAGFPCWHWDEDPDVRELKMNVAQERGLTTWTTLDK